MSTISKTKKQEEKLRIVEDEFRDLLLSALKKCRDGGRGVFLTTNEADREGWSRFVWPETKQLEQLGKEIIDLRASLGLSVDQSLWGLFLKYCRTAGPNVPGASRLAAQFLRELEQVASS